MSASETLHASAVSVGGHAVLIEGRSGSGKSDLVLRLVDRGATLVSDDYTLVLRQDDHLIARAPATIAGRMEVRGIGIVELPFATDVRVALIVQLDTEVLRMPERCLRRIAGVDVRQIALEPFHASAPIKVEYALRQEQAV